MSTRAISITEHDRKRLAEMLSVAHEFNYRDRTDLRELEEELSRANIVESKDIPPTVVTMNSKVRLVDLDTQEVSTFTLVFPGDANVEEGNISVVSPIGTAILGYSAGDAITWRVPGGQRRLKIDAVLYQPEASGDYHL